MKSTLQAFGRVLVLALLLYVIGYITDDKLLTFGNLSFVVAFTALERTFSIRIKETAK